MASSIITTLPASSVLWGFTGSRSVSFTGVSVGDWLLVFNLCVLNANVADPVYSASDGTNTYTKAQYTVSQGVRRNNEVYYRQATTSGSHTVTVTNGAARTDILGHLVGLRVSGITAPADVAGGSSNFSTTPSFTSSTLANNPGLYFSLFTIGVNGCTAPAGWTLVFADHSNALGEGVRAGLYYRAVAATTALTSNYGTASSADNWSGTTIGFADEVLTGFGSLLSNKRNMVVM